MFKYAFNFITPSPNSLLLETLLGKIASRRPPEPVSAGSVIISPSESAENARKENYSHRVGRSSFNSSTHRHHYHPHHSHYPYHHTHPTQTQTSARARARTSPCCQSHTHTIGRMRADVLRAKPTPRPFYVTPPNGPIRGRIWGPDYKKAANGSASRSQGL